MADYSVIVALPDHKRGDWWPGIPQIGPIIINGAAAADFFDAPLERVRWHFRQGQETFRMDSSEAAEPDHLITIDGAATWEASIADSSSYLPSAGRWDFDIEFFPTGKPPITLYRGVQIVHGDVTR
jgi:hypothetical protein